MESFLHYLQTLNPLLIYVVLFLIAFLENIFPPSPSDMVVVFGGSLAGLGIVGRLLGLGRGRLRLLPHLVGSVNSRNGRLGGNRRDGGR